MKTIDLIQNNRRIHDSIYDKYERIHGEIYNTIEQQRLHMQLGKAVACIKTSSTYKEALDYGCGTGNLTKHLIDYGLHVVSADISDNFLKIINQRYSNSGMSQVANINGQDLSNFEDNRFDFVGAYSVLHHVPDYLHIIKEMIRITRYGGIIYLDHEVIESYWNRTPEYMEFLRLVASPKWKKYFKPSNYILKLRQIIDSDHLSEGDIHTFPHDHINWDEIQNLLVNHGFNIVSKQDYLLYKRHYPVNIYENYKTKCSDMRTMIAIKIP